MSDKRRESKAQKELDDTRILVDFLIHYGLNFEDENNFTDNMVKRAKEWKKDGN